MLAKLNEDYPKVRDLQTVKEVEDIIGFLIAILNIKASTQEDRDALNIQMGLIYTLIKSKFGALTRPEIEEAMRMYVAHEFPVIKVFRLLDCVSIGEILSAFVEFRNESLMIYRDKKQRLLTTETKITKEESDKILIDGVNRIFKLYKETQEIEQPSAYIFDFLVEKGKINLAGVNTPKLTAYYEHKVSIAKEQLHRENSAMSSPYQNERNKIKEELEKILNGTSASIIVRTKMLVLKDYFDSVTTETIDL